MSKEQTIDKLNLYIESKNSIIKIKELLLLKNYSFNSSYVSAIKEIIRKN